MCLADDADGMGVGLSSRELSACSSASACTDVLSNMLDDPPLPLPLLGAEGSDTPLDSVEIFDPRSEKWVAGQPMVCKRVWHSISVLPCAPP